MPNSTNQAGPGDLNGHPRDWHPTASRTGNADRRGFAPLTTEERETYRKWRRGTLILYGAIVVFMVALAFGIGPPDPTSVKNNPAYSAIASAGQRNSR